MVAIRKETMDLPTPFGQTQALQFMYCPFFAPTGACVFGLCGHDCVPVLTLEWYVIRCGLYDEG